MVKILAPVLKRELVGLELVHFGLPQPGKSRRDFEVVPRVVMVLRIETLG